MKSFSAHAPLHFFRFIVLFPLQFILVPSLGRPQSDPQIRLLIPIPPIHLIDLPLKLLHRLPPRHRPLDVLLKRLALVHNQDMRLGYLAVLWGEGIHRDDRLGEDAGAERVVRGRRRGGGEQGRVHEFDKQDGLTPAGAGEDGGADEGVLGVFKLVVGGVEL
jgi:hypothetical protein